MIANNACGAHSVAWGTTADNVRSLDVILADGTRCTFESCGARDELADRPGREGELHRSLQAFVDEHELVIRRRFGRFTRQISGYALHRLLPEHGYDVAGLLCGSEGGFAATLRATLALTPLPTARVLCVLGFPDSVSSAECVSVVLAHSPLTMESINVDLVDRLPGEVRRAAIDAGLPAGRAWLLVEMGGEDRVAAEMAAEKMLAALRDSGSPASASLVTDPGAQAVLWRCRRDAAGLATRRADGAEAWGGWEDAAVPPERLADYLRGLDELMARYGLSGASYGHFGEGCMHMRIDFDLLSAQGVAAYRSFVEEATDLVVALGGSVSGEHGDGRARSELLGRMYGADGLALMAEMKNIWDPRRLMNPGVIVDPPPLDAGDPAARPRQGPKTVDAVQLSRRQRRLRAGAAALCRHRQVPTVQRRRDVPELSGHARRDALHAGPRPPAVGDAAGRPGDRRLALDRGARCARLVPVLQGMSFGLPGQRGHGDVQGRVHPPSLRQQAVGPAAVALVDGLAAAVVADRIEGAATGEPHGGHVAGEAPRRDRARTRRAGVRRGDVHVMVRAAPGACPIGHQGRVVLWPDSFTNYLAPQVGRAAVAVLEAAGYEVILPGGHVCCGLTWISTGQLRDRQAAHHDDRWTCWRRSWNPASRSSASNRAALPCCGAMRSSCCTTIAAPPRSRRRPSPSPSSSPDRELATAARRRGGAGADALPPARRSRLRRRPRADGEGGHQRRLCPTPDVAGWQAISASSAATTTCRRRSASGCCYPPSGTPHRTPPSSPTGSAAEPRSRRSIRAGGRAPGRTPCRRTSRLPARQAIRLACARRGGAGRPFVDLVGRGRGEAQPERIGEWAAGRTPAGNEGDALASASSNSSSLLTPLSSVTQQKKPPSGSRRDVTEVLAERVVHGFLAALLLARCVVQMVVEVPAVRNPSTTVGRADWCRCPSPVWR